MGGGGGAGVAPPPPILQKKVILANFRAAPLFWTEWQNNQQDDCDH